MEQQLREQLAPGMMVYIKTTAEQGMIIAMSTMAEAPEGTAFKLYDQNAFTGEIAVVKVPKGTRDNGIVQGVEFFAVEELETTKEKMSREYDEMFEIGSEVRIDKASKKLSGEKKDEDLPN